MIPVRNLIILTGIDPCDTATLTQIFNEATKYFFTWINTINKPARCITPLLNDLNNIIKADKFFTLFLIFRRGIYQRSVKDHNIIHMLLIFTPCWLEYFRCYRPGTLSQVIHIVIIFIETKPNRTPVFFNRALFTT